MTTKPKSKPEQNKPAPSDKPAMKLISDNRRARHDYEILDVLECGIQLQGTEVKAMRRGQCTLQDAFARIEEGEMWLYNCYIAPYDHGNRFNHEPRRKRRLLAHARQILKLHQKIKEKGLALVPLKIFFKRNWVKVDIALARGKTLHDKRDSISKRETKRQLDKLTKMRSRS